MIPPSNPGCCIQVDVPVFHYGDVVRILDDMVQVHSLQTGHGNWNDDMALVNTLRILTNTDDHAMQDGYPNGPNIGFLGLTAQHPLQRTQVYPSS